MKSKMLLVAIAATAIAANAQQPDFSKVEIKVNKISDKFCTLDGQGGTIGILTGPDGVFMVDKQIAPLSNKIAAALKTVTDKPVQYIGNTNVFGLHTGGNKHFTRMAAVIPSPYTPRLPPS